jgi:DNA-binding transcriptional regulator GbsR (MarR family)
MDVPIHMHKDLALQYSEALEARLSLQGLLRHGMNKRKECTTSSESVAKKRRLTRDLSEIQEKIDTVEKRLKDIRDLDAAIQESSLWTEKHDLLVGLLLEKKK